MFKHSKCTTTEVKLHMKYDMHTGYNRNESHMSELYNIHKFYMRCLYSTTTNNGCKGSIVWFDYIIRMMVTKLEMFISNQPTNTTRLATFMLWLSEATHIVVKATIMLKSEENKWSTQHCNSKKIQIKNFLLIWTMHRMQKKSNLWKALNSF